VGSGSKSLDLFADLVIFSLTAISEADRNISSIFQINIISESMDILRVSFRESELILFLMIVVYRMKKYLNLSVRGLAQVNVEDLHYNYFPPISSLI